MLSKTTTKLYLTGLIAHLSSIENWLSSNGQAFHQLNWCHKKSHKIGVQRDDKDLLQFVKRGSSNYSWLFNTYIYTAFNHGDFITSMYLFYHFMKTESHSCKTSLRVSRLVIHDKEVRRWNMQNKITQHWC